MTNHPTQTLEELFARAKPAVYEYDGAFTVTIVLSTTVSYSFRTERTHAALIVALGNSVPAILKEREELRARVEELEAGVDWLAKEMEAVSADTDMWPGVRNWATAKALIARALLTEQPEKER